MKRIAFLMMMLFAGFTFNACGGGDDDDIVINTIDYEVINPFIYSGKMYDNQGDISYYTVRVAGDIKNNTDKDVKGYVLYTFSDFEVKTYTYQIKAKNSIHYDIQYTSTYKLSENQSNEINSKNWNTDNVKFVVDYSLPQ